MTEEKEGQELWIDKLKDPNPVVRSTATYTLRKFDGPEVVQALIGALRDDDISVRKNAAKALGYKKDPAAIPALREFLDDRDPYVIRACLDAIKKIEN